MWDWLLNHWWIANAIPYFAFNAWLLRVFERDEGVLDPSDWPIRLAFLLVGLWGIGFFILCQIGEDFLMWTEGMVEGYQQSPRLIREFWKRTGMWILREALIVLSLSAVIGILYAIVVATTPYRPDRVSIFIEILLMTLLIEIPAHYYLKRMK